MLEKSEIAYIATTRPNGDPHLMPIWFVYHGGKIYFESDDSTVKSHNIQKRNRAVLCFGGKETLIIEGSLKWGYEKQMKVPFRKLLWQKYPKEMDDSFITEKTLIFEVIPERELSWHYAPTWD